MNVIDSKESSSKNEELIKRKQIKDSPFSIITTEEGSFGCIGKYRITEPKETEEEIEKELSKMTWDRIVQVILILIETQKA